MGSDENVVGGDAIQLLIAEYGRAPNNTMAPEKSITDWVRRVGMEPNPGQSWDEMVYLIQRSIAENGIKGFAPAQQAAYENKDEYLEHVAKRFEDALGV